MPSTRTRPVTVRLSVEDHELLKEVAEKNPGWPVSRLIRNFIHERCDELRGEE